MFCCLWTGHGAICAGRGRLPRHEQRIPLARDAGLRAAEAVSRRTRPIASGSTAAGARKMPSSAARAGTREYLPFRQRLSIKVARGGRERYFIDGRSIAVDDDSYLILNDNRTYGSRFESNVDIESFSIFFRPGLAEEVFGALGTTVERALADGAAESAAARGVQRSRCSRTIPSSRRCCDTCSYGVKSGVEDADWYEEQFQFLLERMLVHHRRLTERIQRLPVAQVRDPARNPSPPRAAPSTSCTRATSATSASRRWRGRRACRSSTSCGCSPSCTASRRMPTCSASAHSPPRGCWKAGLTAAQVAGARRLPVTLDDGAAAAPLARGLTGRGAGCRGTTTAASIANFTSAPFARPGLADDAKQPRSRKKPCR